jgi:hypothetical protein
MLNSVVAKTTPQILSQGHSFLNRVVASSMTHGARPFSVAFNVKNKFEDAYEKKMATLKNQPQKAYVSMKFL